METLTDNRDDKSSSKLLKITQFSGIYSRFILNIAICFILLIEIVPLIRFWNIFYILDAIIPLIFWVSMGFIIIFLTNITKNSWIGQFFSALGHVAAFLIVNGIIIKDNQTFSMSPVINYFGWILIVLITLGLLLNLLNFLILVPIHRLYILEKYSVKSAVLPTIRRNKKKIIAGTLISIILGTAAYLVIRPETWNSTTILIEPQDYDAKIAFWASQDPNTYSDIQKQSLNAHSAMLIHCDIPRNLSDPTQRTDYINSITYWNNTYPDVRIMPAIFSTYGGYVWDGESSETIQRAKDYINLSIEENLTNMVGLSFDWEQPYNATKMEELGIDISANVTRHQESIDNWNEFFDWVDINAPDMIMQNINYLEASIDFFDGDNDLQVAEKYNVFDVEGWDEYAPMIYRGSCRGTTPYGDYPNWEPRDAPPDHYWMYTQLKLHSEAVKRAHGNTDKFGVYLGITNCTCYGRDVIQYQNGEEAGYGYDALVRDALIAKHFGAPMITIFLLFSYPMSFDPDVYIMGGVFDTWGDTFLDDFNESINGINSTQSFNIWYSPDINDNYMTIDHITYFIRDNIFDLSGPLGILVITCIVAVNAYMMRKKNVVKSPDIKPDIKPDKKI
jgi:hypothetical protein